MCDTTPRKVARVFAANRRWIPTTRCVLLGGAEARPPSKPGLVDIRLARNPYSGRHPGGGAERPHLAPATPKTGPVAVGHGGQVCKEGVSAGTRHNATPLIVFLLEMLSSGK